MSLLLRNCQCATNEMTGKERINLSVARDLFAPGVISNRDVYLENNPYINVPIIFKVMLFLLAT